MWTKRCQSTTQLVKEKREFFRTLLRPDDSEPIHNQCLAEQEATPRGFEHVKGYQYCMSGHAEQCVERYLELANKDISSLKQVATPCIDDHQISAEHAEIKGVLAPVASRVVLKALYLAKLGRPDILWTVNSLSLIHI